MSFRVLVIEDSADYRDIIVTVLRDILKLDVVTSDNAAEAITLIRNAEKPFDLVTTDIDFGGEPHGIYILEYLMHFSRGEKCIIISGTTIDVSNSMVIAEALNLNILAKALLKQPILPLELNRYVPQILQASQREGKPIKIFISYRRDDTADVTGRIYDRLMQDFQHGNIFRDVDSIPSGMDFRDHIRHHVMKCDVLLAIIGKSWLEMKDEQGRNRLEQEGDFVRIEISTALQRGIPVIPILVQGASLPSVNDLPVSLQDLAYRNVRSIRRDPDFHDDMNRLVQDIARYRRSES